MHSVSLPRVNFRKRYPLTEAHWTVVLRLAATVFIVVAYGVVGWVLSATIWAMHFPLIYNGRLQFLREIRDYFLGRQEAAPTAHLRFPNALLADRILTLIIFIGIWLCLL